MARKRRKFINRKHVVITALVVVAVIVAILLIHNRSKPTITTVPSTHTGSSSGTAPTSSTGSSSSDSSASTTPPDKNASNLTTTGSAPTKPFGNFVSNHSPGGSSPTQEKSTCNTSPGASCYIQFTMGSLTKKLDVQTADSSGAVYWTWDIKDAGFSEGSWQISAIATLNGQTATTSDQIPLQVQP